MDEKLLDPQTDMIIIDIQSIRHWINYCETGNCDDASLDLEMIRDFSVKDLAVYFSPLCFLGWSKYNHKEGKYFISPLKKDFTSSFRFQVQSENNLFPDRKDWYWGLDELKQYLEKDHLARHTANYHAILAKREAELSPDEAARQYALTQLNKFPLDSTIIKVYNMAPSRKSAIKKAWKELPSEIGNYTQLTSLVVDSHFLKELPDSLANLTCLKSLHLGNNRFKVLPAIVGELKTLELLDLEWSAHLEAFPPEIGKLTNLKRIHLKSCTNFKEIPDEMVKLLNLEYIDLTDVNAAHNLKRRLNKLLPNCKVKNFQETN